MQYRVILNRSGVTLFGDVAIGTTNMETYEASIYQMNPYYDGKDIARWGRLVVVPYGNPNDRTWEVWVRKWAPGNDRDLDQTFFKMFNPCIAHDPDTEFGLLVGSIIGRLE